ncbi:hypothetical protein [Deinococcus petrolearius]|uniref:HPr kinase n=1 Tax=Deinococcus petrolearius TaxID=1751295 RepID=A0ABW1DHB4_9DEIO
MSAAPPQVWHSLGARVVSVLPPGAGAALRDFWEGGAGPAQGHSSAQGPPPREITLEVGALPAPPPDARAFRLPLLDREVRANAAGDELWLGGRLWVQTGPAGGRVVCVPGGAPADLWAVAFTELHRAGGWLPLHAAVVAAGDRAVAFTGVSGAGKSTAALRLHAAGGRVLAEDRAFWHAHSGVVTGLDRHLRAYEDSLERFAPALLPLARTQGRDAHGKLRLPLNGAAEATTGEAPRLTRLLVLAPGASGELDLPGRVRAVWEATGVPLTAPARAAVQAGAARLLALLWPRPLGREELLPTVRALLALPVPASPVPES